MSGSHTNHQNTKQRRIVHDEPDAGGAVGGEPCQRDEDEGEERRVRITAHRASAEATRRGRDVWRHTMRESLCRGEIDVEINCPCVRRHELSRSDGEVVHHEGADKNREDYPPSLQQSLSAHGAHGREGYSAEEAHPYRQPSFAHSPDKALEGR